MLKLTYEAYCDLTIAELLMMLAGYHVRWEEQWQHTRYLATILINANSKKKYKPRDLMPLPSEVRAENEIIEVNGKETTLGEWKQSVKRRAEEKVLRNGANTDGRI